MTIRLDVTADGKIELMRPTACDTCRFLYFTDVEKAVNIIRYLLRREMARAKGERFVPQLDQICRSELRKLIKERSQNGKA